ncbi:MAG TPA: glycosyltransferase [Gemmatales bacterium]|nr:glycosyltransferase [Gemmatales bacterium]
MPRRVLVLSAAVGAGHMRAAEAIAWALRELDPAVLVENHDILTFTNSAFRRVYAQFYMDLVNRAPHVLGYFYDLLDKKPKKHQLSEKLRKIIQELNLRKFKKFLRATPWDIILHTHFLPAEIVARLKRKRKLATPHCIVTTDFETHRLWVHQPCEHYFTATEEGAVNLAYWGIPASQITVTGIPIHPVFGRLPDKQSARLKLGLAENRPVILQLAGGFGVGPIEELLDATLAISQPLELVLITGKNEKLRRKLSRKHVPHQHRLHVLGFTQVIHEWMMAADLIMSKPGGLTTSEALACGTPLIVVNPIPGQESRNSDFLLEHGAGIKINNLATLTYKLEKLLQDEVRLKDLRTKAAHLGKPQAAFTIASSVLQMISSETGST